MKNLNKKLFLLFFPVFIFSTGCFKDLDTIPLDDNQITAAIAYDDPAAYIQVLAKCYAGLSVTGQEGPSGQADIDGIDEGFGQYLRAWWYHQEYPTDEAVVGWNDQTIKDFHEQDWDANDNFIFAFYSRIYYQISITNEFLRETTDEKLTERNVDAGLRADIQVFRSEARFLRALSYYHALDHFRNVPFVTEADPVGSFFPEQIQAADLFRWIETELKDIEGQLIASRNNDYGRADQAAAWMLLAKMYLNAEVYTGQSAYTECLTYVNRVLEAGYSIDPNYQNLFLADNFLSDEIIFPIVFDGTNTRTWGGMTFVIRSAIGGDMDALGQFGVESGWGGTRSTSALVNKFPAVAGSGGGLIVAPNAGEEYPEVYVPGAFVGWNPNNAPAIQSVLDDGIYEGYLFFDNPAQLQFKITIERNFNENYGDENGDGTLDLGSSQNIEAPEVGGYKLVVDLNNLTYTLEPANWGIIGSATAGGWDFDEDMTYDDAEKAWTISTVLNPGKIKFRANDDWVLNFGDELADGILTQDGADIDIPAAGTYTIKLFLENPDYTYSIATSTSDGRAMFHTFGQNLEIEKISEFTDGYPATKFKNVNRDGTQGSDVRWVDVDFPMFRLADAYLMYAEAVLQGGAGGDMGTALDLINELRLRAYGEPAGNIAMSDLTLDFILDERSRELHWECTRRTDLVRHGQLTSGTYTWPWKGGVAEGAPVDDKFNIFPIPAADLSANPNLIQNPGY